MPKAITPKLRAIEPITPSPTSGMRPSGRPRKNEDTDTSPIVAQRVYIHAFSSGAHASLEALPLHEVPLMRRKLEVFGESLTLSTDWPEFVPRDRSVSASQLRDEHNRLREKYSFVGNDGKAYDLVQDLYGPAHQGRLVTVMRKQYAAYTKAVQDAGGESLSLETLNTLVQLADPESDFIQTDLIEEKV